MYYMTEIKKIQKILIRNLQSELSLSNGSLPVFHFLSRHTSKMSLEKSKSIEAGLQMILSVDEEPQEAKKLSLCAKAKIVLSNITIEPIMICYILPSVMMMITSQNLTLEKACRVNLGIDKDTCDALSARNESYPGYKASEQVVQTFSANLAIYRNIIQGIIPTLLLLFLGSWSDRNRKRKPLILNPVLGESTTCLCLLISTYFFYELPLEFNVVSEAIPPAVTGGWFAMFVGTYSYISGVTSSETRTTRIGTVHLIMNVCLCLGIALSGVLYSEIGFYGVFSICLTMYLVGYFYGLFFLKDICEFDRELTGEQEPMKEKKKNFLADFFDTKHVKETLRIAFKNDEHNRKTKVCVILILAMIVTGPLNGEMNVSYYYVRYKFGWNAVDYSIFSTFQFVALTLGTMFSLALFTNRLKFDDAILGMIACSCKIVSAFFFAFGPTPRYLYIGALFEAFTGTSTIALRSIISKLVSSDELGKINSLFGLAEAIVPLVYGPLYSKVYSATIRYFPGAFYITGAGLIFPAILIFMWLYVQHRNDKKGETKNKLQEEKLIAEQQKQ